MKLPEFEDCLKRGKIVRFAAARKLAAKEVGVAKAMREGADYENTFDAKSAKALVEQAEEFLKVAEGVVSG